MWYKKTRKNRRVSVSETGLSGERNTMGVKKGTGRFFAK